MQPTLSLALATPPQLALTGESSSIKFAVEPQFFDLGLTPYDRPVERDLHISNSGGGLLVQRSGRAPDASTLLLPLLPRDIYIHRTLVNQTRGCAAARRQSGFRLHSRPEPADSPWGGASEPSDGQSGRGREGSHQDQGGRRPASYLHLCADLHHTASCLIWSG